MVVFGRVVVVDREPDHLQMVMEEIMQQLLLMVEVKMDLIVIRELITVEAVVDIIIIILGLR